MMGRYATNLNCAAGITLVGLLITSAASAGTINTSNSYVMPANSKEMTIRPSQATPVSTGTTNNLYLGLYPSGSMTILQYENNANTSGTNYALLIQWDLTTLGMTAGQSIDQVTTAQFRFRPTIASDSNTSYQIYRLTQTFDAATYSGWATRPTVDDSTMVGGTTWSTSAGGTSVDVSSLLRNNGSMTTFGLLMIFPGVPNNTSALQIFDNAYPGSYPLAINLNATTVPETASLALLATAGLMLAGRRRNQR